MLELVENDLYYYDAEAGDRPVRFFEKFLRHYEGEYADKPFLLTDTQKKMIRDVHGWKFKATGLRRFTDWHFEAAVGAGKSPLMAGLGLFHLCADGEKGAQVYVLASSYTQAKVIFDTAKRFIEVSPDLSRILQVREKEIRHPKSKSVWKLINGKRATPGLRPSCVLMDEIQEVTSAEAYTALRGRFSKRSQPLFIGALNAGNSQVGFGWQIHEKTLAALQGRGDPRLYPIIWAAPEDAKLDDPAAWKAANQLLGVTITEQKVRDELNKCTDAAELAEFARKYLSRWPKAGGDRWLDMALWDASTAPFDPKELKDAIFYAGLDLALGNDLCAAVCAWLAGGRTYIDSHFWMTRENATLFEKKWCIPYSEWEAQGKITIVDRPVIGEPEQKAIADYLTTRATGSKIKAICYDQEYADYCVAQLTALNLPCVPIQQAWRLSPGCNKLVELLREKAVTIAPNPVLRFCAENTQVKDDGRNIWPIKPHQHGTYKGRRHLKIDGVTALVTLLVEARKYSFPKQTPIVKAFTIGPKSVSK